LLMPLTHEHCYRAGLASFQGQKLNYMRMRPRFQSKSLRVVYRNLCRIILICHSPSTCNLLQGGTCIFSGDEAQLLEQAAELAQQKLHCKAVFGSEPLFKEGYSRARFDKLDADARWAPDNTRLHVSGAD